MLVILKELLDSNQCPDDGKGELQLDIKGLAPLYTGLFIPQQLQITGKLKGTETSLDIATQIFASTSPWMADFF
ncbi:MAG: sterol carrier protein domain-containing protein [Tolypothrix brevis GSE-NOS-MK-07-07A]|jgi:predicted acetyltransferase|nr:sterol carrier protein domain-containing protein [Tolypothrix brevis GSE-NOS-MK-07-07A]